ncbi:AMP-binding protein [Ramlibacter sp.]|uniref:AMP-binding protein n=1 Tax=Ramlibacter sp. TaxID=1917967 RepID=UPI003D1039C0
MNTPTRYASNFHGDRAERWRREGRWPDLTLGELAKRRAEESPRRTALVDGREYSFATFYDDGVRLASALLARGLKPGDVVSFQLPNWYEGCVVCLAAALAGLVANPLVPIYREAELKYMLANSRSRLVFIPAIFRGFDYRAMIRRVREEIGTDFEVVCLRGDAQEFTAWSDIASAERAALPDVSPDDPALVLYTSGSSGRAKGVLHTHNTLLASIDDSIVYFSEGPEDVNLVVSPITHITGFGQAFLLPITVGLHSVLVDVWEPAAAMKAMIERGVTIMNGATPFLAALAKQAAMEGTNVPKFRRYICGGAQVPPGLIFSASEQFTNAVVHRVYGSTELGCVTAGTRDRGEVELGANTDGRLGRTAVRIVDPVTGVDLPLGSEGEIVALGPQMCIGYIDPADNANALDEQGFFRTGDLGRMERECLVITGRKKDLIIRNGENISPLEIEEALAGHPDIRDVAVVAMPSEKTGECACAFIVARGDRRLALADIAAFMTERGFAKQKIPEWIEYVDELPVSVQGKVQKVELRARAREIHARAAALSRPA